MNQKLLTKWNSLKPKLEKLIFLNKHKELIKEALEAHLNFMSSFTGVYSPSGDISAIDILDIPKDYQITSLQEPTAPQYSEGRLTSEWKEYQKKLRWNAYLSQKEKSLKRVEECREILMKLT